MSPDDAALEVSLDVSAVPTSPTGAGRYVVELVGALAQLGECHLTLVTRRDDRERWALLAPGARLLATVPAARPVRLAYEQLWLGPAIGRLVGPSVEVHHGPHYTMPRHSPVPCVVTVHDLTLLEHPEWHERSKVVWFRHAIRSSASHAAVLVCVSETTAARLGAVLAPRCPVVVAAHGVDRARFAPRGSGDGEDAAELSRLHLTRPFVLHLGTLEPRKGIEDLVAAFGHLAAAEPELELVLAGVSGWGSAGVERAVAASAHSGRIRRIGYVPDVAVPALLRQARAVAYPSLEEGFGLPALEALSCGAPLVTTVGTAMAEVAGDAAWLVPPRDPAALAAGLERAIHADDEARRKLGFEVASRHTWKASAERHLAAYRIAVESRSARVARRGGRPQAPG